MPPVVFVAPFFLDTTLRFVDAVASLPGVRCGLVSQDRSAAAGRSGSSPRTGVEDGLDAQDRRRHARELGRAGGGRCSARRTAQVLLGEARRARIGHGRGDARNFRDKAG
jgi:hypothetical protein